MARKLTGLLRKFERVLGANLQDFRSGLEEAHPSERILGFIVSSDFEGLDHRQRQSRMKSVLEREMAREELQALGPIVTLTPSEAEVDWTWERLLRLWEAVVSEVGSLSDHDDPNWWLRPGNKALRRCLERFVEVEGFPRGKWTAAHQQVKFGVTPQREVTNPSHARTWIRNHAAALEAGFLRTRDLPHQLRIGA